MKGWICCTLLIALVCAKPTSSRAYIPYVPPQPHAKRYKVVKTLRADVSRYIKPQRKDYSSEKEFRKAVRMNGKGKETFFGTKARFGMIAANLGQFKRGTILRIKELNHIEIVEDRCAKAEKESKKGIVLFDIFSNMSPKQAMAWGRRKMTVEILQVAKR